MISQVSYTMTRGEQWDRLVLIKNRRTHRTIPLSEARCMVQVGTRKMAIPVTPSREGGAYLSLDPSATLDFPAGDYSFDIAAPIRGYWRIVAKGTLSVAEMGNVTPLQDGQQMEIRFKKGEDYRNTFSWFDSDGNVITVTDAYMQAKDSLGATVLDLRWYATAPDEATIGGLTANRRGYLAPYTGETLELHISELNSVPAGTYDFDLFVKGSNGDWKFLSGGTVVVESSVSTRPA